MSHELLYTSVFMLDTAWCTFLWIDKAVIETIATSCFDGAVGNIFDIEAITCNIISAVALPDR